MNNRVLLAQLAVALFDYEQTRDNNRVLDLIDGLNALANNTKMPLVFRAEEGECESNMRDMRLLRDAMRVVADHDLLDEHGMKFEFKTRNFVGGAKVHLLYVFHNQFADVITKGLKSKSGVSIDTFSIPCLDLFKEYA